MKRPYKADHNAIMNIKTVVLDAIEKQSFESIVKNVNGIKYIAFKIPVKINSLIQLLRWSLPHPVFYLKVPSRKNEVLAWSTAQFEKLVLTNQNNWQLAETLINADENLSFIGGKFFEDKQNTKIRKSDQICWNAYQILELFHPMFYVEKVEDIHVLTFCHFGPALNLDKEAIISSINEQFDKIDGEPCQISPLPKYQQCIDLPERSQWSKMVDNALNWIKFNSGQDKVVLARKKIFHFKEPIVPALLIHLLNHNEGDGHHYLFYFSPSSKQAFMGASPEKLFSINENMLETEALAGTRPRGKTLQEDKILEDDLISSQKEQAEQQFVHQFLYQLLSKIGEKAVPSVSNRVVKLKNIQHLQTGLSIQLKNYPKIFSLLQEFHPTPAVGGMPKKQAMNFIQQEEPFTRGFYASPIGIIKKGRAEFFVAIRSALVNQNEIHLFAGAGIVNGSRPDDEWIETENKLKNFSDII